jgi:hypothetical protein
LRLTGATVNRTFQKRASITVPNTACTGSGASTSLNNPGRGNLGRQVGREAQVAEDEELHQDAARKNIKTAEGTVV